MYCHLRMHIDATAFALLIKKIGKVLRLRLRRVGEFAWFKIKMSHSEQSPSV